jgi:hypothetical protein
VIFSTLLIESFVGSNRLQVWLIFSFSPFHCVVKKVIYSSHFPFHCVVTKQCSHLLLFLFVLLLHSNIVIFQVFLSPYPG